MNSFKTLAKSGLRYRKHLDVILEELEFESEGCDGDGTMYFAKSFGKHASLFVEISKEGKLEVIVPRETTKETFLLKYILNQTGFSANDHLGGNPRTYLFSSVKRKGFTKDFYDLNREIEFSVEAIVITNAALEQAVKLKNLGDKRAVIEKDANNSVKKIRSYWTDFCERQH